jgi:uncharacterized protein YbcI
MPEPGNVDASAVREEIAREIARVHEEAYGTGVGEAQVHLLDETVLVVMDVELSRSEQTLLDAGKADAVRLTRESFQEAISPTFVAIVERATGRRVNAFLSRMSTDPLFAVELFRLEPASPPPLER